MNLRFGFVISVTITVRSKEVDKVTRACCIAAKINNQITIAQNQFYL